MMLFWGGEYLLFWKYHQGIKVCSGSTSLKGE